MLVSGFAKFLQIKRRVLSSPMREGIVASHFAKCCSIITCDVLSPLRRRSGTPSAFQTINQATFWRSNHEPRDTHPETCRRDRRIAPRDHRSGRDHRRNFPPSTTAQIEPILSRVVESTKRRRRILSLVQDALGQLRLDMKYLAFDLEATRRERDDFRRKARSEDRVGGKRLGRRLQCRTAPQTGRVIAAAVGPPWRICKSPRFTDVSGQRHRALDLGVNSGMGHPTAEQVAQRARTSDCSTSGSFARFGPLWAAATCRWTTCCNCWSAASS